MAEFKIGRLRFTWRGTWTTGTAYNRDAVIQHNGKTYVCLQPHTAGNFADDIAHLNNIGDADPYWQLLIDGKVWRQAWLPDTLYGEGEIVTYGGIVYVCTVAHTSGTSQIDLSKWTTYSSFDNWHTAWMPNTVYGIGDVVKYGGIVYRCITNHASAATAYDGLEADQAKWEIVNNGIEYTGDYSPGTRYKANDIAKLGPSLYLCTTGHTGSDPITIANWSMWMPGSDFVGTWLANRTYQQGEEVLYGGYSYVSNTNNNINNIPTAGPTNWSIVTTGFRVQDEWQGYVNNNNPASYRVGDVVRRNGVLFVANADSFNQDPANYVVSTTYTASGSSGTTVKVADTTGITVGAIVIGTGFTKAQTVVSVTNGTTVIVSEAPDGTPSNGQALYFSGVNYAYWTLLVPGTNFRGKWRPSVDHTAGSFTSGATYSILTVGTTDFTAIGAPNNTPGTVFVANGAGIGTGTAQRLSKYSVGDLVLWQNATYRCIKSHTADTSALSTNRPDLDTSNSWVVYVLHARNNALNTEGDIVYRGASSNLALPIGTQDYILRSTSGLPSWQQMFITPGVYYVSNKTGVDSAAPTRGLTWDRPWKTIKYACETLVNGTQNPQASWILRQNKEFIVAETWNWMVYQINNNIAPFTGNPTFSQSASYRDARYVLDAIIYDISRGGNSQTVAATLAYFAPGSTDQYFNASTTANIAYIKASLVYLTSLVASVINGQTPASNYQTENAVANPVLQVTNQDYVAEAGTASSVASLLSILNTALARKSTADVPAPNQGLTATIYVKTGTYEETLPIVVPENVCIVGDELRGVTVQPKIIISTVATATKRAFNESTDSGDSPANFNYVTVHSTENLYNECPVQFAGTTFGGIVAGQTYYVIGTSITPTTFKITDSLVKVNNAYVEVSLTTATGTARVYGGDSLSDMFRMRNATGLRNMTLQGLLGTLTAQNQYLTQRPTGGAYVALDPGTGPDDSKTWIVKRSPYCQNVSMFGEGCVGMKIDGSLHNGGNKSMVANDFTTILSNGIGAWVKGTGALTELVSVFAYYGYAGYLAEDGGKIRATNGNTSYGTYGVIAEGYDVTEVPISATIYNRTTQATATLQHSQGINNQLLTFQYSNAGQDYNDQVVNMLFNSNNFLATWSTAGSVTLGQNLISPNGTADAWQVTSGTNTANTDYLYQDTVIYPTGATFTNVSGTNLSGGGTGATFDVAVNATQYTVTVNVGSGGGTGYVVGNQILILGSQVGGADGINDITLTIDTLTSTSIATVIAEGVVVSSSALRYTSSVHFKQGTSDIVELGVFFTGYSTKGSVVRYTFSTGQVTAYSDTGGLLPANGFYGIKTLTNGWYRLWVSVYDINALNNNLQLRVYPRGRTGTAGYSYVYGAQVEVSDTVNFYLETSTNRYSGYANYRISGSGNGAIVAANETRSKSVYQVRVTDPTGDNFGGAGYLTASNNAQYGTPFTIQLAGSDTATESKYVGMRVFINSGTGVGQYGYITSYDSAVSKVATVVRETFDPQEIVDTAASTGLLTLGTLADPTQLYIDQPVQFIPTYYNTTITETSTDDIVIAASTGGQTNTFTCLESSTDRFYLNMPVTFSGTLFGNVVANFTYYISDIVDQLTFRVSTTPGSTEAWPLVNATGAMIMKIPADTNFIKVTSVNNMTPNMPILFTGTTIGGILQGTTYYVNDIFYTNKISISTALLTATVTATTAASSTLTTTDTSTLTPLTPIRFTGTTFGTVASNTTYYISKIVSPTTFQISTTLIRTTVTGTIPISNLIVCTSTAGFIANNPIIFSGPALGGIDPEVVYYISAINNTTSFTVSKTPGGTVEDLILDSGYMYVRTSPTAKTVTTDAGTLVGTTTSPRETFGQGVGSMNAIFSTPLFGGVTKGTTYYIKSINLSSTNTISIAASTPTASAPAISLTNATGSMELVMAGWDHVNPGTPPQATLDASSLYFIEPRPMFTAPAFLAQTTTIPNATGLTYNTMGYGENMWMAVPNGGQTIASTTDGVTWASLTLPVSDTWSAIAYGTRYWVIIATGSNRALYSASQGQGWRQSTLPATTTWSHLVYGNGKFVAIATGTATSAYSANFGGTWSSGTGLGNRSHSGLAYGAGTFVAIATGTASYSYSTDGINWITGTLPSSSAWSSITYGNGRFVVVSTSGTPPIYSYDGISWSSSPYAVTASKIVYGQGVFLALNNVGTTAYTSEDAFFWKQRTVTTNTYNSCAFGFRSDTKEGVFIAASGSGIGSKFFAGAKVKGRPGVVGGLISSFTLFETGSNYTTAPTLTFFDPNSTSLVTTEQRLASGVLSQPTFINRGQGYATTSTAIIVTGNGYRDQYRYGLTISVNNLTRSPRPGDNLTIAGDDTVYKVTTSTVLNGTTAPNITADIQISPDMSVKLSPENGTAVTIRQQYSQVRLTGHDFLNVGYGDFTNSNYPGQPLDFEALNKANQAVETNYGRVFYTSTDQDGNFLVGGLFGVEQATGIVTLSASQFDLGGLTSLSLGGIAVGGNQVVITQFSTDPTFVANSNTIIPTQKAIKSYLAARLTQGGSNTYTGQTTAGVVVIGGPDKITNTIPQGTPGSSVRMKSKVNIAGIPGGGVDGDMAAAAHFYKSFWRKGDDFGPQ